MSEESAVQNMTPEQVESAVTLIKKADLSAGILQSNAAVQEDEFEGHYIGASERGNIIAPPINKKLLASKVLENNTLGPCVSAMEVNIDGTGCYVREKGETTEATGAIVDELDDFFSEVYPQISFTKLRRDLRRDVESCGDAYMEVIRNAKGEVSFLKRINPTMMRLVKLEEPIIVERKVWRKGGLVTVNMKMRERVFAQMITGKKIIFFKEYGSLRKLDKTTGKWETRRKSVAKKNQASEILHLKCIEDMNSPYGQPRWISQTPSVIGSRMAETFNVDFFDSGGIPPILVFLNGGSLNNDTRQRLESIFNGKNKHRGAVVEVQAMGGSIDKPGSTNTKVERFGAERAQDSMFENYDTKCEGRIRSAFRLPPLFLGKAEGYTFATAYASYVTAEAQVFKPERDEFDKQFNSTIMRELAPGYEIVSNDMLPTDIELQLRALGVTKDFMDGEEIVKTANNITGLNMKHSEEAEQYLRNMTEDEEETDEEPTNPEGITEDGGRDSNTEGEERPEVPATNAGVDERNGSGSDSRSKK